MPFFIDPILSLSFFLSSPVIRLSIIFFFAINVDYSCDLFYVWKSILNLMKQAEAIRDSVCR